jgi:histidyl-tRNA synthetase
MAFQKLPGTQDFLPDATIRWQQMEETLRTLCAQYNFREIRTPMFEATELFRRGVGEMTDIVSKEMYTFTDRGDRSVTLRPEGTAGTVRAYVENKLYGEPDVSKLYYVGPMFRYERAQAGRYRQFHQWGVEALGSAAPALDAEVIALGYQFLRRVGLRDVHVEINSVGTPQTRAAFAQTLIDYFTPYEETLCADCQMRLHKNPFRILDCKIDGPRFPDAPQMLSALDTESRAHFDAVLQFLDATQIPYEINPRLVRGLDYYTLTAFEYRTQSAGALDTVGGGGRYNGLVQEIGGPETPGIGFALGLERVALILAAQEGALTASLDAYFIPLGAEAELAGAKILQNLRAAGLTVDRDYMGRKMKAQLKSAVRLNASFVVIVGEEELAAGEVTVKTLATGEQTVVKVSELVQYIKAAKERE